MTSLHVANLHPNVAEWDLEEKFADAGPIESVKLCRDFDTQKSLGRGYVNFQQPADALWALETYYYDSIMGRPMRISWARSEPPRPTIRLNRKQPQASAAVPKTDARTAAPKKQPAAPVEQPAASKQRPAASEEPQAVPKKPPMFIPRIVQINMILEARNRAKMQEQKTQEVQPVKTLAGDRKTLEECTCARVNGNDSSKVKSLGMTESSEVTCHKVATADEAGIGAVSKPLMAHSERIALNTSITDNEDSKTSSAVNPPQDCDNTKEQHNQDASSCTAPAKKKRNIFKRKQHPKEKSSDTTRDSAINRFVASCRRKLSRAANAIRGVFTTKRSPRTADQ